MAEIATLVIEVSSGSIDKSVSSLRQLSVESKTAEEAVSGLSTAFKILGTAMAAIELGAAIKNTILLAARYETLGATMAVMGNNAGYTGEQMSQFQKEIEKTGISAIKSRQALQIMAAAQLDLKGTTEGASNAARLARVAQDAAVLAGIDSSTAMQNLVRGITTGESRIIRHMGIMVNFNNSIDMAAHAQGRLRASFSPTELASIRLEAALAEGSKRVGVYESAMTTAGKQMLSMVRYTENLQVQLGTVFNPALNAVVFALVDSFKELSAALKVMDEDGTSALFASKIRASIISVMDTIKSVGSAIWNNMELIKGLAAAYAAVKLGSIISGWVQSATRWYASINQGAAIQMNEIRNTIALIAAKNAAAASRVLEAEAAIASAQGIHGTLIVSTVLTNDLSAAQRAQMATAVELRRAQIALATATAGATTAQSLGAGLMGALGGPIGIAVIAIGGLIYAWQKLRDKTMENAAAASKAGKDAIDKLTESVERNKKIMELMKADPKKSQSDATKETDAAIAKARDYSLITSERGALDKKLMEEKLRANKQYDSMLERQYELEGATLVTREEYVANVTAGTQNALNLIQDQVVQSHMLHDEELKSGNELEKMRIAARGGNEEQKEALQKFIQYENELEKIKERGLLADQQGHGFSTEQLKKYKLEEDAQRRIAEYKRGTLNDRETGKPKYSARQAENLIDAENISLRKQLLAIDREEDLAARKSLGDDVVSKYEAAVAPIKTKTDALAKLNRTELDNQLLEIAALRNARDYDGNLLYEGTLLDEKEAELKKVTRALELGTDAQKQANDARAYADQLNKGKSETDDAVKRLDAANRAVDKHEDRVRLLPGVYEKAWLEVMMKGDTMQAYIVQNAQHLFDGLGTALGNFVTGTRLSFKSMLRDMAAEIARFYAQKAVQELFKMAAKWYLGGSGTDSPDASSGISGMNYAGFAEGGRVAGTNPIIVGEQGPELFMPGQSGTIVPNNALGGSSQTTNHVNVVVNMEQGKKDTASGDSDNGRQTGLAIAAAVRAVIIDESRPGGYLFHGV